MSLQNTLYINPAFLAYVGSRHIPQPAGLLLKPYSQTFQLPGVFHVTTRDSSTLRWNYWAKVATSMPLLGIFHMPQICDMGQTALLPSRPEGRRAEDFFALKNPTASAGFQPANLGTKGQHATSWQPKPLIKGLKQLRRHLPRELIKRE